MNSLLDPPFAQNPPVKVNVNAKTLGLVLLILGAISIFFSLIGLIVIFGFCGAYGAAFGVCSTPLVWMLGTLISLAATVIGTIGAYRMYQGNAEGKLWVVYGLILGAVASVISMVGNYTAYSGLRGVGAGFGAVLGLIIGLAIYFIVYYLVVISRFPGEAPLTTYPTTTWGGGGPSAPPPPPPL